MTQEEQAFIQCIELAMDWNMTDDITALDIQRYYELLNRE